MSKYHYSLTLPAPNDIRRRQRYLEKVKAKLEKRLTDAPGGRLSTSRDGRTGTVGFYYVAEDNTRVYLNQSRKDLIQRLAQKEYDRKALRLVEKELRSLRRILDYCEMPKLEDAYDQCVPEKQAYITPVIRSDEAYRKDWLSQKYDKKKPVGNDHPFSTEKGDMVASKSEEREANYMFHHGYDYLYEKRVDLVDNGRPTWRYPDFTILDPVTREEVIFEHFGMVDDEEYRRNMFDKIRLYEENGYIIGKNLLFTFETRDQPLTMDQFIGVLEGRFPRGGKPKT